MLRSLIVSLVLLAASPATAQRAAPVDADAPPEARQFDFLVGEWRVDVRPKVSGLAAMVHGAPRLVGTWKAWPEFDGFGVEDELRIVDASGNPASLSRTQRMWSRSEQRWIVAGMDVYRGRMSSARGRRDGDALLVEASGTDPDGKPYAVRTRFTGITADAFELVQDRSADGGRTWDEGVLEMSATRVAPTAAR